MSETKEIDEDDEIIMRETGMTREELEEARDVSDIPGPMEMEPDMVLDEDEEVTDEEIERVLNS